MKKIKTLLIAGLSPLLAASAFATNGTWNTNGSGNWGDSTKWLGSNIANGVGSIANLTFDITAASTVTLNGANQTVGILNMGDPTTGFFKYTLAASSAALILDNSGAAAQINISGGALGANNNNTISAPLQLTLGGVNIANTVGGASAPLISGAITSIAGSGTQVISLGTNGSSAMTVSGNITNGNTGGQIGILVDTTVGAISLTGSNSFTGGITVRKGTVSGGALGVSSGNGNIQLGDSSTGANGVGFAASTGTYLNNITVDSSGTGAVGISNSGASTVTELAGDLVMGRNVTATVAAGALLNISGDISGAGGLTAVVNSNGFNTLTLSGNNTFSGGFSNGPSAQSNFLINLGSATAIGAGTWTIGPSTPSSLANASATNLQIDNTSGSAITLTNNNSILWSNFTFVGTNDLNLGTGSVSYQANGRTTQAIVTVLNNKLTVGGVISDGVSAGAKGMGNAGAGTLALTGSNTYTGTTSVGGILAVTSLADGGVASNIGQSANAAANLLLNRGTLQYTGGVVTTDRLFTVGNGGGTIESSGAGALIFGNTGNLVSTDSISSTAPTFTATPATTISVGVQLSTAGLAVGQTISGTGISPGTTITQILDGTRIVISSPTTAASGGTYIFGALDRMLTLTGNNTGSNAIAGVLADAASKTLGVTKSGAGTWTLSAANTYTGATLVNAGTLVVSAGNINSSAVTVAAGGKLAYNSSTARTGAVTLSGAGAGDSNRAILGGTGTINVAVTLDNIGDTLSPGNSPGVQNFAVSQTWSSYTYLWETNNFTGTTPGTDFDQITITGSLNLSGTNYLLDLNSLTALNAPGNVPNFSDTARTWTILTTTTGISGFNAAYWTIATGNFTSSPAWTGTWAISQSSNDLILSYSAIPEPTALALVISGALCVALFTRRRRS